MLCGRVGFCALALVIGTCVGSGFGDTVYTNGFDSPAVVMPGVSASVGGNGSAAFIGATNQGFASKVLRDTSSQPITITLSNLPTHNEVSVSFILAALDSWDGNGSGAGAPDYFDVKIDGNLILQASYNNVSLNGTDQAPAGTAIVHGGSLSGTAAGWKDSVYDLSGVGALQHIAHTSSTLAISFQGDGRGWGPGSTTESFAVDDIKVDLFNTVVIPHDNDPPPTAAPLPGAGVMGLVILAGLVTKRLLPKRK